MEIVSQPFSHTYTPHDCPLIDGVPSYNMCRKELRDIAKGLGYQVDTHTDKNAIIRLLDQHGMHYEIQKRQASAELERLRERVRSLEWQIDLLASGGENVDDTAF